MLGLNEMRMAVPYKGELSSFVSFVHMPFSVFYFGIATFFPPDTFTMYQRPASPEIAFAVRLESRETLLCFLHQCNCFFRLSLTFVFISQVYSFWRCKYRYSTVLRVV